MSQINFGSRVKLFWVRTSLFVSWSELRNVLLHWETSNGKRSETKCFSNATEMAALMSWAMRWSGASAHRQKKWSQSGALEGNVFFSEGVWNVSKHFGTGTFVLFVWCKIILSACENAASKYLNSHSKLIHHNPSMLRKSKWPSNQ